jgi:hypothetical protein
MTPEMHCADCSWEGASTDCPSYPEYGTAAWKRGDKVTQACPVWRTEKGEDR